MKKLERKCKVYYVLFWLTTYAWILGNSLHFEWYITLTLCLIWIYLVRDLFDIFYIIGYKKGYKAAEINYNAPHVNRQMRKES